ncbi:MAG: protein tyrosine phosphatase family protein [Abitibacteriaceae bacterium]|nr:protein tyrosine phosphatase family protein [Abditibacteriaceae bacterium]
MLNERKITNEISISGQPTAEDIADVAQRGFRMVVNLRAEGEQSDPDEEKRLVEEAGLNYTEIPVTPASLDDLAVQRFQGAVTGYDSTPAIVHCGSGGRAGIMVLLHLALTHGWSIQQALEEGEKMGNIAPGPDSPYRQFFESFLKRHSPAER